MVNPDSNWSAGLSHRLELLSKDRLEADVLLCVGDRQIPAHKFVLDAYCDIMKTDDAYYSVADKLYHVIISDMSEENYDLFCGLITSLYTGCIEVTEDDAKFVYKFAKIYNVDWLKSKIFGLFENMIIEATFIDILKFSHSICCEDLKELCLDYLTPNFLESLITTGELLHINYYCLCTIINNGDSAVIPEIEKFRLVCKWFETDVTNRICHLSPLIALIKFNTFEKSDLCLVFEWAIDNMYIDDCLRFSLLKNIKTMANVPILPKVDEPSSNKELRSCRQMFEKMKKMLSGNIESTCKGDQSILLSDYCSVVKRFYSSGDSVTKQLIIEFLCKNWEEMVTKDSTTDLVRLNDYEFNLFPFSIVNTVDIDAFARLRELMLTIKWGNLSFENLNKFVKESRSCELQLQLQLQLQNSCKTVAKQTLRNSFFEVKLMYVRIVECIMNWALANAGNDNQILGLLNSSVCLCFLPDEYLNVVLQPYLLTISTGRKFSYQCYKHNLDQIVFEQGNSVERQNLSGRLLCCCQKLTPKIYMLMKDNLPTYQIYESGRSYTLQFLPENKGPLFGLCSQNISRINDPKFILFDTEKCMEQYPVWSACNLNLNQLREIVATNKHLSVMFFEVNK